MALERRLYRICVTRAAVGDELVDARLDRDVELDVVLLEPLAHALRRLRRSRRAP